MQYEILKFIKSRSLDFSGFVLSAIWLCFAVKNHSVSMIFGNLACMSGFIAILLGPKISLRRTVPQIYQQIRDGKAQLYSLPRRIFLYLTIVFFIICLYFVFAS